MTGTASPSVAGGPSAVLVRRRVLALIGSGVDVAVVSGTDAEDIDRQLHARPAGPGRLWLCVNRGSELFEVTAAGPRLARRRVASAAEDAALDAAAVRTIDVLRRRGLAADLAAPGLNCRRIDLVAEPERSESAKARTAEFPAAITDPRHQRGLANLPTVVRVATESAMAAGLRCPRITGDARYVEIGVAGKSDSMRELLTLLARRGVGPGLVLVVGGEFGPIGGMAAGDSLLAAAEAQRAIAVSVGADPGGVPPGVRQVSPDRPGLPGLLGLLDEQADRRRARRVPGIDEDPAWVIREGSGDPLRRRVAETICSLGAAGFGTRGSVEEPAAGAAPLVVADGIYRDHGADGLLPGPLWTGLLITPVPDRDERVLDLRTGVLARSERGGTLRTLRFASATRPGVVGLRAEAALGRLRGGDPLQHPDQTPMWRGSLGPRHWARTGPPQGPGIAALAEQHAGRAGSTRTLERIAAYTAGLRRQPALGEANGLLDAAVEAGFDRMLAEHRAAWAQRWDAVDIGIPDDPATQLGGAVRAVSAVVQRQSPRRVGSRRARAVREGLRGACVLGCRRVRVARHGQHRPACGPGHGALPLRRLGAARSLAARAAVIEGARFPWESAATGTDVTPRTGRLGGTVVPIRDGCSWRSTSPRMSRGPRGTARQWTGDGGWRGRHRADATAWRPRVTGLPGCAAMLTAGVHIDQVIGPDEYHESVNDNAYTNVMARWNLRAAARRCGPGRDPADTRRWRELADVAGRRVRRGDRACTSSSPGISGWSRCWSRVHRAAGGRRPALGRSGWPRRRSSNSRMC